MSKPKIVCVVPTCRRDRLDQFIAAWDDLFEDHGVELVIVFDGVEPKITRRYLPNPVGAIAQHADAASIVPKEHRDLFCRYSDVVRNYGFVYAAQEIEFDYMLTLDDDVTPPEGRDPIAQHLSVMGKKCSTSWMNAAMGTTPDDIPYLRGHPYGIRTEATVHLSHGVWTGVPDFDARTQLAYGDHIPPTLDYYRGPVPRGAYMPICGMNLMCSREALPYLYYAPMGPDSGFPGIHRFGDIWMGAQLKDDFDQVGWAIWTGTSVIEHNRASDAHKNLVAEAEGIKMNEWMHVPSDGKEPDSSYLDIWATKAIRYRNYMIDLLKL